MVDKEVGLVMDDEYKAQIETIKSKIKHSQIRASVKMNYEMSDLYWDVGRDIVVKQRHVKWGDVFPTTMSRDLKRTLPNMSSLSVQNLESMRYWYRFYSSDESGLQAVSQFAA